MASESSTSTTNGFLSFLGIAVLLVVVTIVAVALLAVTGWGGDTLEQQRAKARVAVRMKLEQDVQARRHSTCRGRIAKEASRALPSQSGAADPNHSTGSEFQGTAAAAFALAGCRLDSLYPARYASAHCSCCGLRSSGHSGSPCTRTGGGSCARCARPRPCCCVSFGSSAAT
jgi:type II secretory pathway pseudopilin PulG